MDGWMEVIMRLSTAHNQRTDRRARLTDGGGRVVKKLEPVGGGRAQVRPGVHRVHEKASNL